VKRERPRAERLAQFGEDIQAWREGRLELVTRRIELPEPPAYTGGDVRRIRDDLNMSRLEFARLLGVSQRTVESWEHGHRKPRGAVALVIHMYANPPWRDYVRLPGPPAAGRPKGRAVAATAPRVGTVVMTSPVERKERVSRKRRGTSD